VVTTTTHKTLRGPRGGMILAKAAFAKAVDSGVFPGMQGGPLDHVIAAKAVCFAEALKPSFVDYQKQVVANAKTLAQTLLDEDIRPATGGTDNHLMLIDLTKYMTGKEAEKHLQDVELSVNKNMIPFDTRKPMDPSGLRIGTPAITTRGLREKETAELSRIIASVIKSPTEEVKASARAEVKRLADKFPLPY
jgi:glycine hydroxymethyltransferase